MNLDQFLENLAKQVEEGPKQIERTRKLKAISSRKKEKIEDWAEKDRKQRYGQRGKMFQWSIE